MVCWHVQSIFKIKILWERRLFQWGVGGWDYITSRFGHKSAQFLFYSFTEHFFIYTVWSRQWITILLSVQFVNFYFSSYPQKLNDNYYWLTTYGTFIACCQAEAR